MNKTLPPTTSRPTRRADSWLLPAAATVLLHGGAFWMLYSSWSPEPPASAPSSVMVMQLVTLPQPAPEPPAPAVVEPAPLPEPVAEVAPPAPPEPQVDQAEIARKRLEEQAQREKQQRLAEQRRQQEQERQRQQAQARREQQQREAEQRALAEQQRLAAEAQARALAEAEAARRAAEIAQYQPISKKPPAYPRRALDRGLEGDCTVTYTVTEDGRVADPRVVEGACDDPLFVRPSLAAAKSFRYQPRTINGQRVAVADVRNTFRYRIQ